jgi:hypothetical protein
MRADGVVWQMKILILHEHEEIGEAISTEQIWKRTVRCVPLYRRRLSWAEGEKQVKGIHIVYESPEKVVKDTWIS